MTATLKGIEYEISASQVDQAREWMLDCSWCETEEELEELSDLEIVQGIEHHFSEGWRGFLECALPV